MLPSFLDRQGTETFREPSSVWGYLPQLNEWAGSKLEWFAERVGGKDHQPEFEAFPIYDGERLEVFKALGKSKKAAKEEAARLMCTSGHCVSADVYAVVERAERLVVIDDYSRFPSVLLPSGSVSAVGFYNFLFLCS
ncbi:hypothetical protein OH76DRAFT_1347679 [Lentinus brumalis]|uniref:DRBM domain-containing protein n=1 Tax=Lentinus brumalis TaxID=2498619 RepID=A0A371DF82_9APHY|nr:hypothetical protein OH76DRAFT_1347679 [Polyporus brumalis]